MNRPRLPLVFGQGLDRSAGVMAADPRSPRDLRNVYPYAGQLEVRKGLEQVTAWADDAVLAVAGLRTERIGIVVTWDAASRHVDLYRTDAAGENPEAIVTLFTLAAAATTPPRVVTAESYGRMFVAHDEPAIGYRAATRYYDTFAADFYATLRGDLDGAGEADIRFRGVVRHLSYLFGWGYGSASEPNRPELLRASLPGQPTDFEAEHYFIIGQRGDPIITAQPAGSSLLAFKETEFHEVFGYDRSTFGQRPIDTRFGCMAARLAINVGGSVFFWSEQGPRVTSGGASEDLALPLNLRAPEPASLVASGDVADGFAVYLPARRAVLFIFGQRVYCLSLWENPPRWSYHELGVSVRSGGLLWSGESLAAVVGYPAVGAPTVGPTWMEIPWANVDAQGDELVEVWMRPAAGAWSRMATADHADENVRVEGLTEDTDYDIALRFRHGTSYSPNSSDSSDPSLWPAAQRTSASTVTAPSIASAVWSRTSDTQEKIALALTLTDPAAQTFLYRKPEGGAFTLIATLAPGVDTYDDVSDDEGLVDPNAEWGEVAYIYYIEHATSSPSAEVRCWAGPLMDTSYFSVAQNGTNAIDVQWRAQEVFGVGSAFPGEVEIESNGVAAPGTWFLEDTVPNTPNNDFNEATVTVGAQTPGHEVQGRARRKLTTGTAIDYSEYTVVDSVIWT